MRAAPVRPRAGCTGVRGPVCDIDLNLSKESSNRKLATAQATLGQPEAFIQAKEGLFDAAAHIGPDSRKFLQGWVDTYVAWVRHHAG